MLEALWSVEFVSNVQGFGAGVAVFETGRVLGGDASYTYVGKYSSNGNGLVADIVVSNYRGAPHSVFGAIPKFTLHLEGVPKQDTFDVHGHMVENPNLKIDIRLTRRAELP
jgi:hypothetical protein